jgi:hypothetical protein
MSTRRVCNLGRGVHTLTFLDRSRKNILLVHYALDLISLEGTHLPIARSSNVERRGLLANVLKKAPADNMR